MLALIQAEAQRLNQRINAIGGLTLGADSIAVAVGMTSWAKSPNEALQVFIVLVVDDVVTRGESTLKAIHAAEEAGAKVAFVAVLVDREEGGCDKIRNLGYNVVALIKRSDLILEGEHHRQQTF